MSRFTLHTSVGPIVDFDEWAQCTATTVRGERCRNPVFISQVWTRTENGDAVLIEDEYDPWALSRAIHQLCHVHVRAGT